MSSCSRQRYYGQDRENDIKYKYSGQPRMLQVCLNYEGSQAPLTCTVDGENLKNLAIKSGVKDIITLYDNGSTQLHPNKQNVVHQFIEMAQRCLPGDILIFQYSGHGTRVEDEDGDEEDGYDEALCLTSKTGEPEDLIDDQLAEVVYNHMNIQVPCLFLMDCCHSGSLLDLNKKGVWGAGRKVFLISGCQDNQYSGDTGNGGVMTHALLAALNGKACKKRRKKRTASIQFIFNRMIEKMPQSQQQQEQMQQYSEQEQQWQAQWQDIQGQQQWGKEQPQQLQQCQEGEQQQQMDPNQTLNLSWNGGSDPTRISFPF